MCLRKILEVTLLSSLLVACNNNDTSTDNDTTDTRSAADKAYVGERVDAALTVDNVSNFIRSAFAAREFSFNASSLSALLPNAATRTSTGDINTTTTCTNNGQASDFGSIDATTKLGNITTIFKQCLVKDTVVDGKTETTVSTYDATHQYPSVFKVTFDALSMSKSAKSVTLIGLVDTHKNPETKTAQSTLDIHLKAHSGEEVLLDMTTDIRKNTDLSVNSTLNGKVCVDSQGCANIQTVTALTVDYNGVLNAGELTLTGANTSQANVKFLSHNRIQVAVDKDGDGTYEDQKVFNQ